MPLNVTTLISAIWPFLHASGESDAIVWTDAELTRYFQDHLKRFSQKFGCFVIRDITTITLVNAQATYSLPERHISTLHVSLSNRPLVASARHELERLDVDYITTAETSSKRTKRWYQDKQSEDTIGFQPVPATSLSAGSVAEVIYHEYPCNLDELHNDTDINTPSVIGDYLEFQVIGEAYSKESDLSMPEVAQSARALAMLYEAQISNLWQTSQ